MTGAKRGGQSDTLMRGVVLGLGVWVLALGGCPTETTKYAVTADTLTDVAAREDTGTADVAVAETVDTDGLHEVIAPVELPIEPSTSFLDRKQEYLQFCYDNNGPGTGGVYGQCCRVFMGADAYNEESIQAAIEKVKSRLDTSDFRVAGMVRMLYLDLESGALPEHVRDGLTETLLGFRFWLTEPGDDKMCFWTENHQILFHSGELLAGQFFSDEVFPNSGMTGAEHVAHAEPWVERWLDNRARFGFSEWHSNVYFNEDIPALVNLVDFAESEVIRTKAAMVLDLMAFDMLTNYYKGYFATTHGRTYSSKFLNGMRDSTHEAVWLMVGLSEYSSPDNFSGTFLATSEYVPLKLLEDLAAAVAGNYEHRQRDSIFVVDGPDWGIGYEETMDVVFWAGLAGLVASEVINGTVAMLDDYDLWEGFLFGDIPEPFDSMLKQMAGTPELEQFAQELEVVSRGIALESVNTYTYRTPHYQMSGAQDYKPGYWATQTQSWVAALDGDAFVLTSFPGNGESMDVGLEFGDKWIGGWQPRVTMHRNVAVIQYRKDDVPMLDDYLTADYLHAFFPRSGFDEIVAEEHWVFGRKGSGYVALGSEHPVYWSEEFDYELITDTQQNIWIVELGSTDEWESFEAFVDAVKGASLTFGEKVEYESPSVGQVTVGWTGPMTVKGETIDLGPFDRWDNPHCNQEYGTKVVTIRHDGVSLELDFEHGTRRLLEVETANP